VLSSPAERRELVGEALEALSRYRLRTSLSVLGVVLGIAAVIAMMSVSEGAADEALAQVEALGLDNLVARSQVTGPRLPGQEGLSTADSARIQSLVPLVATASPLVERFVRVSHGDASAMTRALGVREPYARILRLSVARGRFLTAADERSMARVCVLGAALARQLFGYRDPLGDAVRVGPAYYRVVGLLEDPGAASTPGGSLAWRDHAAAAFVPIGALSGRPLVVWPDQAADEIWIQLRDGTRANDLARVADHVLATAHPRRGFAIVVPRELLAERYSTQRTFSIVVGSVAVLALVVGGIGIMNMMLTSVVERTREIGVRRTVGATRRDITQQFLVETLLMTVGGGLLGILLGVLVASAITAFAGWNTQVSMRAIAVACAVSVAVGLIFGIYPAMKAAALEPVDAMRYE
jgi:putative ABC transport system permease protein